MISLVGNVGERTKNGENAGKNSHAYVTFQKAMCVSVLSHSNAKFICVPSSRGGRRGLILNTTLMWGAHPPGRTLICSAPITIINTITFNVNEIFLYILLLLLFAVNSIQLFHSFFIYY